MRTALAALAVVAAAPACWADGIIVDPHRRRLVADLFTVREHLVTVAIDGQHAVTEIDQRIRNVSGQMAEAVYLFPLPHGAQVSGFEMWIGERKVDGEILPAEKAREIYNSIVRSKRDPALLEYVGLGTYRTSVFPFAPEEEKHLRIRYSELLRKDSGLVRYVYPLNTEKFSKYPLEEARVEVRIRAEGRIKNLYSPTHPVQVTRGDDRTARVSWSVRKEIPRVDFELYYSTDEGEVGASVLTFRPDRGLPGFFLFLASPRVEREGPAEPKDIVFVLDTSGSMREDNKIGQAREALTYCLRSLNPGDRFGLVRFSDRVEKYADRLLPFNPEERDRAAAHVLQWEANGGTNLQEALLQGLSLFEAGDRLKMMIFLTDGLPTVGVTDVGAIVRAVGGANTARVRLFAFGVGHEVNTTLLDKIARENGGDAEYVKPRENLEARVSGFYAKVQSPVLSDLAVDWGPVKVRDLIPERLPDLFRGGQVLLTGRYEGSGPARIALTGRSQGRERRFEFEVSFEERSEGNARLFVERLWAQRRIGQLLDQIQLYGKSGELVDEVVRLSTRYGILTPYTSFLIREDTDLRNPRAQAAEADRALDLLRADTGRVGAGQAELKAGLRKASEAPAPAAAAPPVYRDLEGREVRAETIRVVGRRTFFRRGGVWQEADLPAGVEAVPVAYFSDEFFRLLEEHPELNLIATLDADVLVRLGGRFLRLTR